MGPYAKQYQQLNLAHQSGQITDVEYQEAYQKLQTKDKEAAFKGVLQGLACGLNPRQTPLPLTNPFADQYQELENAYQTGKLTYPQYLQARQNLQAQELQWRNNMA